MENKKPNAVIFCPQAKIAQYLKKIVSWSENKLNLYYRNLPYGPSNELSYAWKNIKGQIDYVFVVLDLRAEDKKFIEEFGLKVKIGWDKIYNWPDSFELIFGLDRLDQGVVEKIFEPEEDDNYDDEDLDLFIIDKTNNTFNPCVITFSEKPINDHLIDFLALHGVSGHFSSEDKEFNNQELFFREIKEKAEELKKINQQVRGFIEEE